MACCGLCQKRAWFHTGAVIVMEALPKGFLLGEKGQGVFSSHRGKEQMGDY